MDLINDKVWEMLESYMLDNPNYLIRHHIDAYNRFYKHDIYSIFKESNAIRIVSEDEKGKITSECKLNIGGKDANLLYFIKLVVYDGKGRQHFHFPNEARLRNMNYAMTIHYDVDIEIITEKEKQDPPSLHGGSEFTKRLRSSKLEIIEEQEDEIEGDPESMWGGNPKNPRRKNGVVNDINQIRTTPAFAKVILEQANNSISVDDEGIITEKPEIEPLKKILLGRFPIMV